MRKAKPVIIFLAIQFVIAVALSFVNITTDEIILKKGEKFKVELSDVTVYGVGDEVAFHGDMEIRISKLPEPGYSEYYGVIETGNNGIAYISEILAEKPENKPYIKVESLYGFNTFYKIPNKIFNETSSGEDMLSKNHNISKDHKCTAEIYVYKGEMLTESFLVDGEKIEIFILEGKKLILKD